MAERLTHPDAGMVYACPECDTADVYRRENGGERNAAKGVGDPCACSVCPWTGEKPEPRPAHQRNTPPEGPHRGLAKQLLDADAEDVGLRTD